MIDFHSHILPKFDDGSESMDMTFEMLESSKKAGVSTVVSTSHCYPKTYERTIHFINKRERRLDAVKQEVSERGAKIPKIIKAAEVNLITDFSEYDCIKNLCIENTNYILVEMPLTKWKDSDFDIIYSLIVKGFRPIIAHIDRYAQIKNEFENFMSLDLVFQINADCFLSPLGRHFAYKMIKSGMGHIIGSDMHNMSSRPSHIKKAYSLIEEKLGAQYVSYFEENGKKILLNESIDKSKYWELPEIKRLPIFF